VNEERETMRQEKLRMTMSPEDLAVSPREMEMIVRLVREVAELRKRLTALEHKVSMTRSGP